PAASAPSPPAASAPAESVPRVTVTGDLGDTDLLHAMLETPGGVRPVALALITQSTGWEGVQLLEADDLTPGIPAATVMVDGVSAGVLVAENAPAVTLAAWAEWLGRWLTADTRYRHARVLADRDDLTGAWNRRYFRRFLGDVIERGRACRRPVTVMVFDIDDFKQYNDRFGHQAGDEILRETVGLLDSVIRRCDRVCRIGGDEFAVVFADLEAPRESGSRHPESVELIARRFQEQIGSMRFPKLGQDARGTLSISGGLATFPWDGDRPEALLALADQRALESKRRGKNHLTFGAGVSDG
ncbi:MAG: GGDEF domain-containing protein, partial [Phycisphaerales bacterium]|nr:GGDEF domain-containing protein [Phycisphaerae bacterium]NNM27782.1 GGDEF domain-containing protein [Phycisphaerales bacterium]